MGPTDMPNQTGAVPQQQVQAAQGTDMIGALLQQNQLIGQEIQKTLPSALTPIRTSGVASPTLPGSFNFNVGQPQLPPAQGHRDAVRQGVAKAVAGVGSIVSSVLQQKKEEKQRILATDIHRVLEAQDAVSQAKQLLQQDPNNKDAKAALNKNTQIINDTIGADPKKLKQFEKAFDINFLKPEENTSDEHGALKSATKDYASQLEAKTPEKFTPNTQAISKVQALQAQAKQNQDTLKTVVPMIDAQTKAESEKYKTDTESQDKRDIATQTNQTRLATTAVTSQARVADAQTRARALITAAGISGNSRVKSATITADAGYNKALDSIDERSQVLSKITDPLKRAQVNKGTAAILQKQLNQIPTMIHQTEANRAEASKHGIFGKSDPAKVDQYNKMIQLLELQQKDLTDRLSTYAKTGEFPSDQVEEKEDKDGQQSGTRSPSIAGSEDDAADDYSNSNNPIYDSQN